MLEPLIAGEDYPACRSTPRIAGKRVPKKLKTTFKYIEGRSARARGIVRAPRRGPGFGLPGDNNTWGACFHSGDIFMDATSWLWLAVAAGALAVIYGVVSMLSILALPAGNARGVWPRPRRAPRPT